MRRLVLMMTLAPLLVGMVAIAAPMAVAAPDEDAPHDAMEDST